MRLCGKVGVWRLSWCRALARRWLPVGWLEPFRSDYVGHSPNWKHMSPEVYFQPMSKSGVGVLDKEHNQSWQPTPLSACLHFERAWPGAAALTSEVAAQEFSLVFSESFWRVV